MLLEHPARSVLGPALFLLSAVASGSVSGCAATPNDGAASSTAAYSSGAPAYLALGDSVVFGYDNNYRDLSTSPPSDYADQTDHARGYPEAIADVLASRDGVALSVANVSCPGEATGSFIDGSRANDNNCWDNRHVYPLHYEYDHQDDPSYGARTSQLEWALRQIRSSPEQVKLVTLTLGANDLGRAAGPACNDRRSVLDWGCFVLNAGDAALSGIERNFERIFDAFGNVGYTGPLVIVDYYALSYGGIVNPGELGTRLLNAKMHDAAKAAQQRYPELRIRFVEGFDVFENGSRPFGGDPCAASLTNTIDHPTDKDQGAKCDAHPSPSGHRALAEEVLRVLAPEERAALVDASR